MAKIHPSKLFKFEEWTESDKKVFDFYKANPVEAFKDILNQDLAPFQRIIVKGNMTHPFVMNALARGSGKTRLIAGLNAIDAMFNPKMKVAGLGPGFRSSKIIFNELEALYDESEYLQQSVVDISKQPDVWKMIFTNGAIIYALPLAADSKMSIRGIRAHRIRIDEYPHVPVEVIDAVLRPMGATRLNPMKEVRRIEQEKKMIASGELKQEDIVRPVANSIQGFSSAYFQFNHFYKTIVRYRELAKKEILETGKSKYAVYVFNINDAPEGFFDRNSVEDARLNTAPIIFRMEWLSEFPSDSDGFFRMSLLSTCISKPPNSFAFELEGEKGYKYFMGIDPARENDAFAIHILKLVGNEMRWVRCLTYQQVPFPIIAKDIRKLLRDYDFEMIGMDRGGGGSTMRDLLADPMSAFDNQDIILDMEDDSTIGVPGRRILKLVDFAPNWIQEANFNLQSSFEHKRLMFPDIVLGDVYINEDEDPEDKEDVNIVEFRKTLKELSSIIITHTPTGVLHFSTPQQRMRKDRYSSLLIAHQILYEYIKQGYQQKELASGGWLGENGILTSASSEEDYEWGGESAMLDKINRAKNSRDIDTFGALEKDR